MHEQGFEMESLESDFLMDAPLMEPSMPLPLQHHGSHTESMHLSNGGLNHGSLDPLHDLPGGDEDYKEMLQILVPPTLPTSSCKPSHNQTVVAPSSKTPRGVSVCCCSLQGNFPVRGAACSKHSS